MIPLVAHTVAFFCERPIANAFGIGVSATATRGLGRSACTHSRSIMGVQLRRLGGRDLPWRPARAARACRRRRAGRRAAPPATTTIVIAPAPAANSTPMKTT